MKGGGVSKYQSMNWILDSPLDEDDEDDDNDDDDDDGTNPIFKRVDWRRFISSDEEDIRNFFSTSMLSLPVLELVELLLLEEPLLLIRFIWFSLSLFPWQSTDMLFRFAKKNVCFALDFCVWLAVLDLVIPRIWKLGLLLLVLQHLLVVKTAPPDKGRSDGKANARDNLWFIKKTQYHITRDFREVHVLLEVMNEWGWY
jgi:hypothetical protein